MVRPPHPVSRRMSPSRPAPRARRVLLLLGLGIALAATFFLYGWWVSPEHRLQQFVSAGRRGDTAAMLSLADPKEVKRLGLTPEKFAAMLAEAARAPRGVLLGKIRWEPLDKETKRYFHLVSVPLLGRDGAPLPDTKGKPAELAVEAYNTDRGWKVSASKFLYMTLIARHGMEFRKERYAALCRRYGTPPEFYWPSKGEWERIPTAP